MDGTSLADDVAADRATELERLGSSRALLWLVGPDLDADAVLATVAAGERAARDTFEAYAAVEPHDGAASAFREVADREADHYERVLAERDGEAPPEREPGPVHAHLRAREDTVERVAAGLLGRALVSHRTLLQVVNYFVEAADEARAALFREFRESATEDRETAAALLDDVCDGDEDWRRARDAATATVDVAYDAYADALGGMGLDPTPVC